MKWKHLAAMVIVGVCLGLLEAAWTTPSAPGATKAGLGCVAIAIILAIVCWPRIWWVPGLSMLEEAIQKFIGQTPAWHPNPQWLFHHWSAGYFGINLYPVISFTLITILGEVIYLRYKRNPDKTTAPKPDKRSK